MCVITRLAQCCSAPVTSKYSTLSLHFLLLYPSPSPCLSPSPYLSLSPPSTPPSAPFSPPPLYQPLPSISPSPLSAPPFHQPLPSVRPSPPSAPPLPSLSPSFNTSLSPFLTPSSPSASTLHQPLPFISLSPPSALPSVSPSPPSAPPLHQPLPFPPSAPPTLCSMLGPTIFPRFSSDILLPCSSVPSMRMMSLEYIATWFRKCSKHLSVSRLGRGRRRHSKQSVSRRWLRDWIPGGRDAVTTDVTQTQSTYLLKWSF